VTWWSQFLELIWPEWVLRILGVVAVWVAARWLVRHLGQWIGKLDRRVEEVDLDRRELQALDRLLDVGVTLLALLLTAYLLNLTGILLGLLTAAGVMGIALGFAAKDVVSNFISGFFLILDQTLAVGDFVDVGGYSGTVKQVTLRATEIVTLDGTVVTIPNSAVATGAVVNYSLAERRRVRLLFSLMIDQDLDRAAAVMLEQARADGRVLADLAPNVTVNDVRDQTMELALTCFAAPDDWLQLASDLRKAIVEALGEAGIELAVPVLKNL